MDRSFYEGGDSVSIRAAAFEHNYFLEYINNISHFIN